MRPLLFLLVAATACGSGVPLDTPPEVLGGQPLHHEFGGQRALQAVDRLHQAGSAGVDSAWIAHYGTDEPSIMLYVGIAADSHTAAERISTMKEGITTARTPFQYAGDVTVNGRTLQLLRGQGQLHYVFTIGRKAVWLSADPETAAAALADILGLDPGDPVLRAIEAAMDAADERPVAITGLGPLLQQLIGDGVLDTLRLGTALVEAGQPLTAYQRSVLAGADRALPLAAPDVAFLLNTLWTLGLANRNPVLTRGPMVVRSQGRVGRFASTGGWRLGPEPATRVYAGREVIPLSAAQQERLESVTRRVFRPCCDNSTYFPDCNHGMAMLGLLTLLAAQGADQAALFDAARAANEVWFPVRSRHIAAYLEGHGLPRTAQAMVGPELASSSGHRNLMTRQTDTDTEADGARTLPC